MAQKYFSMSCVLCVCLFVFLTPLARADDETPVLGAGKPAPALQISKYLKGAAPDMNRENGCVVVVFFNLDDEKIQSLISTLNGLFKDSSAKGLQMLLVSKEKPDDISKTLNKSEINSMLFAFGADEADGTWRAWPEAAKMEKLPVAFIVCSGKIVWVGNPSDSGLPMIVRKAVVGKYDPDLQKKAQPILDAAHKSLQVRNVQEAYKHFDEVIEMDRAFFLDVIMERYKATLANEADPKVSAQWILKQSKLVSTASQNSLVMMILKDPDIQQRDLESALAMAESIALKDSTIGLQAKASVFAAKKDWPQAIDLQTDAWMGAPQVEKAMAKQRMDEYRAASKIQSGKKK